MLDGKTGNAEMRLQRERRERERDRENEGMKEDGNSRGPSGENEEAHLLDIWFGGVRSEPPSTCWVRKS